MECMKKGRSSAGSMVRRWSSEDAEAFVVISEDRTRPEADRIADGMVGQERRGSVILS